MRLALLFALALLGLLVSVPAYAVDGWDWDCDGIPDIAIYRQTTGVWYIRSSLLNQLVIVPWGCPFCGDIPVPADYDHDGCGDVAVYRPTTGQWFIQSSFFGNQLVIVNWGSPGTDVPVTAGGGLR